MRFELASILAFLVVGVALPLLMLTAGGLVRPRTPNPLKGTEYECGELPSARGAWFNFNPRFYVVALVFLVFDVEVAFTWPVAAAFRRWVAEGRGATAFVELALFIVILAVGLAYVWRRRDLDWIREREGEDQNDDGDGDGR